MLLVEDDGEAPAAIRARRLSRRCEGRKGGGVAIVDPAHPARRSAEALIETAYRRAYGGAISRHFDNLFALTDAGGSVVAAAGFRWAHEESLFLEQYLDAPVEKAVAALGAAPPGRDAIVEIGNLASDGGGASAALFAALAGYLEAEGARLAVATATRRLRRLFGVVGFETSRLADADRTRLADAGGGWGSYYAHDPVVVAGSVTLCAARIRSRCALPGLDAAQ